MILFLDFDGVLHPDAVYLVHGRPVLRAEGQLFMWAPILLNLLREHPEVKIVLSTRWVRVFGFSRARRFLPTELSVRVCGATWHSAMRGYGEGLGRNGPTTWDMATRYQQIRRYVDRAKLVNWLAIDDDDEGWASADAERLVKTEGMAGLSDQRVVQRIVDKLQTVQF